MAENESLVFSQCYHDHVAAPLCIMHACSSAWFFTDTPSLQVPVISLGVFALQLRAHFIMLHAVAIVDLIYCNAAFYASDLFCL